MNLSDNLILNYFIAYLSGVAVSFTPCVYPLMPVTASIIGGLNTAGRKSHGFLISVIYVSGMAIMYCALGVIAALTGKVFGQLQNHPFVFLTVGQFMILFSLVMFDVIPLPSLGLDLRKNVRLRNYWSVVLLGMASGLIVGPCTAPVLGTLLLVVASGKQIVYAVSLLFVFSYGVGTSLILIGTFSGLLSRLPKIGAVACGNQKSLWYYFINCGRISFYKSREANVMIRNAVCSWIVVAALALTATAAQGQFMFFENPLVGERAPDFALDTLKEKQVKFSEAKGRDKAVLFFWATWCPHCREALKDLGEKKEEMLSKGIRVILVDLGETVREVQAYVDKRNVPFDVFLDTNSELSETFNIIGVPTFVFVGEDGIIQAVEHALPEDYQSIFSGTDIKARSK